MAEVKWEMIVNEIYQKAAKDMEVKVEKTDGSSFQQGVNMTVNQQTFTVPFNSNTRMISHIRL